MGKLDNKVILVTGAARGIGKGCVSKILLEGAKVIATDINNELLKESESEWSENANKSIRTNILDISSEEDWKRVMSDIEEKGGIKYKVGRIQPHLFHRTGETGYWNKYLTEKEFNFIKNKIPQNIITFYKDNIKFDYDYTQ